MIERPIFRVLKDHLTRPEVTVITGMRRTGKTTALRYLFDAVPHQNKLYLDLERLEYRRIFMQESFLLMENDLKFLGFRFDSQGVIALDEVQLVPSVVSFIKYYLDHKGIKFLISGSSSYYLKGSITESLAGRKRVFELYPLDFLEFLAFRGIDSTPLAGVRSQRYTPLVYERYVSVYEEYLTYGGFPQVVLESSRDQKLAILKDILESYLELDVKILSDYTIIDDLYRLAMLLTTRIGSKVDYQKIGVIAGLSRHKVRDYIQLFESTYFIKLISAYSGNMDRTVAVQPKIYLSDNGFIQLLNSVSGGSQFENAIAIQLSYTGHIQYYQKRSGQEIDFILNGNKAIEVKETPVFNDLTLLKKRALDIGVSDHMLIGRTPPSAPFNDFVWGGCIF